MEDVAGSCLKQSWGTWDITIITDNCGRTTGTGLFKCGEAYNTANPDVRLTIAQLAEIIASAANRKVVFADPDDVDLAYRTPIAKQVLSSKKLENLGWSGVFSAEIGVKHTLDILLGK